MINFDNLKSLEHFLEYYPEFVNEEFSVQEKIDGTNIQIKVHLDGMISLGSRNRSLTKDMKHFGFQEFINEKHSNFLDWLKNESKKIGLNNLIERYKHISEKTPAFYIKDNEYVAEIPLLDDE